MTFRKTERVTRADVVLTVDGEHLRACGYARHRSDHDDPVVGESLAAARALERLAAELERVADRHGSPAVAA